MAANDLLSSALEPAAVSDPRNYRLVFMFFQNDSCTVSVQNCFDIGAMTYNVNSDTTQVLCNNLATGKDEVVAVIEGGATSEVSMELSRYLPKSKRSMLLRLAKQNCGLRVYLLRGDRCKNPLSVDDFDVLEIVGGIRFTSAYSRTEIRHKSIANSQEVSESSTITGFNLIEVGKQLWATRGGATLNPIVDIKICDTQTCGGLCDDESDGCQVVFWVDTLGNVWYSTTQLESSQFIAGENLSGLLPNVTTIEGLCCVDDQLVIIGSGPDAAATGTAGKLWIADIVDVVSGAAITWTEIVQSTNGIILTDLPLIYGCETDGNNTLWLVGEDGFVAQYDPVSGQITVVNALPNILEDYLFISIQSNQIIIGGTTGIFITSDDAGRSFVAVEVIDPATLLALAADITAGDILLNDYFSIGLSDGRVLCTLNGGANWFNHILPSGMVGGAISDIHYDTTLLGYVTTVGGDVLRSYYGCCRPLILMPESDKVLAPHGALNALTVCSYDPDVVFVGGASDGGAGYIAFGKSQEA